MKQWLCLLLCSVLLPLHAFAADPAAPSFGPGRVEAEDMQLSGYYTVENENASGGKYIKLYADRVERGGVWASSSFVYSGRSGEYNIDVVYPDFYSGASTRKLYVNGEQISTWAGKITYGSSVWGTTPAFEPDVIRTKTVRDVVLRDGDEICIVSKQDYGEYGELDYIEIYQGERETEQTEGPQFTDLDGHAAAQAVLALAQDGIVGGSGDGRYRPDELASLEEFLTALVRLMGYQPVQTAGHWAQGYRDRAQSLGWVTETELLKAESPVTETLAGTVLGRVPEVQEAGAALPTGEETLTRGAMAILLQNIKQSLDTLRTVSGGGTKTYPLDSMGYIKNWLYTGMVVTDLYEGTEDKNTAVTHIQTRPMTVTVPDNKTFSAELENGMEFRPYPMGKSGMLNDVIRGGDPDLAFAEGYLCADLVVEQDVTVSAKLHKARGYDEVYLNGKKVASLFTKWTRPASTSFTMQLKAGVNRIFVRLQNLDANIITITSGIQLLDNTDKVRVAMPALEEQAAEVYGAEEWAFALSLDEAGNLAAQSPPPAGASVLADGKTYPWPTYGKTFDFATGMNGARPLNVNVRVKAGENQIDRELELVQNYEIQRTNFASLEEHQSHYRQTLIASGGKDWDYIQNVLLKISEGMEVTQEDNDKIMDELVKIDQMNDCAEFGLTHALRLFLLYPDRLEQRVRDKMKDTILNFGYWSDEEGTGSMVMSSENHEIGFYGCQFIAGRLYPDETFTRSGRTGRQQEEIARTRLESWLSEVETYGFEEYNSSSYVDVTFNALLNLYDLSGDDAMTARAETLLDLILYLAAVTTFDGVSMGAEGRVYAERLYYPATSQKSMILSYLSTKMNVAQYSFQVMGLATSDYQPPADLDEWIDKEIDMSLQQGGATLSIRRTADYLISGTTIPTEAEGPLAAQFVPGGLLYQYHLWEATLSADTKVFVTHPGAASESSTQRPGYWFGEQSAPVIRQEGSTVMEIYNLPSDSGITFTHAYFTADTFDETRVEGQWLFGRRGDGYVGLWCSRTLEPYGDLTVGREYRADGLKTAWVCQASSAAESGSFAQFVETFKARTPTYDETTNKLYLDGAEALRYQ